MNALRKIDYNNIFLKSVELEFPRKRVSRTSREWEFGGWKSVEFVHASGDGVIDFRRSYKKTLFWCVRSRANLSLLVN